MDPQNPHRPEEAQPLNNKEDTTKEDENERSFYENICFALKNVTLEPTMVFFIMSTLISIITTQNLSLEKACRVNLNYSSETCHSLKVQQVEGQHPYEREAQKLLASAMAWKTYITATIPCIIALFVGSWSDKTGHRKIFIILPIAGQALLCINNIINTYFFYELRLEHLVFSEAIIEALSGGWCLCFITMFSYISAITNERNRTFRMGLINFSLTVGFPLGMGLSGILLKKLGYYGTYGFSLCFHILNLFYNVFVVKDPKRTSEQKEHDGKGVGHFMRTFFDLTNLKDTVKTVFKDEPKNRRIRICVLLSIVTILFGPMYGEISILYLSTRYRFNWDEVKFSIFQTYNFVTHTVGTVFSILFFSKYLQWHDSLLGLISTVSKIAASFVYCFAKTPTVFYFAPLVEILNGTSLLAMRSIVSKLVAPNELGKVNSIFGLVENLMPLLYVPLYTKVYTSTMEVLPGAVFLMGACMTFPAVLVFIYLFYEHRQQVGSKQHENLNEMKSLKQHGNH